MPTSSIWTAQKPNLECHALPSGGKEGPSFITTSDISGLQEDGFLKANFGKFLEQEYGFLTATLVNY
jgi:hypothetical protein